MFRRLIGLLVTFAYSTSGCKVDDRELQPIKWTYTDIGGAESQGEANGNGPGGVGGTIACDRANGGCIASTGAGGAAQTVPNYSNAGAGSASNGIGTSSNGLRVALETPGVCNDLNGNAVVDRKESLVVNSNFDRESEVWEPEEGVSIVWNPADVCGSADSGSLNLSYQKSGSSLGQPSGAATQCIAATPGRTYSVSASFFLQTAGSQSGLGIVFFSAADCTGKKLSGADSPTIAEIGVWSSTTVMATAPSNANSLGVRITAGRFDWKASQAQADILADGVLAVALP